MEDVDGEQRWAEAQSVLDRAPTPTARERIRRRRVVTWWSVGAVLVFSLALGTLLFVLLAGSDRPEPAEVPGWQEVTGLVVQGVGLVVEVVGLVVVWRAGVWRNRFDQPWTVLTRAQRRGLLAQVRGRVPVDPVRLPFARDVAERVLLQRGVLVLFVGLGMMQIGRAVASPDALTLVLTGFVAVCFLLGTVLMTRDARRARRFLDEHPDPRPEG